MATKKKDPVVEEQQEAPEPIKSQPIGIADLLKAARRIDVNISVGKQVEESPDFE